MRFTCVAAVSGAHRSVSEALLLIGLLARLSRPGGACGVELYGESTKRVNAWERVEEKRVEAPFLPTV
jgi:hypothetical protein